MQLLAKTSFGVNLMKRWLIFILLLLTFGTAQAQGSYVGFGLSQVLLAMPPQYGLVVLPEVQLGGPVAPEFGVFGLRANLSTLLFFSNIGVDVLLSISLPEVSLRMYWGGGPDLLVFMGGDTPPGQARSQVFFGGHGTLGLEFLSSSARPFVELQPAVALLVSESVFGIRARAGLNLYF